MEHLEQRHPSVLEERGIQELIKIRQIKEEDWPLLEELTNIPKDFLFEFHNFFNMNEERSTEELAKQLDRSQDPTKRKYYELLLHFSQNYHWMVCYNLERVLERRYEK